MDSRKALVALPRAGPTIAYAADITPAKHFGVHPEIRGESVLQATIRVVSTALIVSVFAPAIAQADISPKHERAIAKIQAEMRKAQTLFQQQKWSASARVIAGAKARLADLPEDEEILAATKSLSAAISKAEDLLEAKGIPKSSGKDNEQEAKGQNNGRDRSGSGEKKDGNDPKGKDGTDFGDATKKEDDGRVSFSETIAGVLAANCTSCHGGDMPRRGLRIESYATLARGGQSGAVVQAGNPTRSLLVAKLKGNAPGKRMPLDADPLPEQAIAAIETWIREGAKFDGSDPATKLERLANVAKSAQLSDDERNRARWLKALRHWKLAFPDPKDKPERAETESFLVVGKLPTAELQQVGEAAEAARSKALKLLKLSDEAAPKGRITIFILPESYAYGEFGKMVEKRQLPPESHGHWREDDEVGYIVLGPPPTESSLQLETELVLFVSAVMAKSWGTPAWFADGLGHLTAEKANRRDPEVRTWKNLAPRAIRDISSGDSLLDNELPPEISGVANWAFTRFLLQDARRGNRLLEGVMHGTSFETAFAALYGTTPQVACELWVRRNGGGKNNR
jgi:cytochrome c553